MKGTAGGNAVILDSALAALLQDVAALTEVVGETVLVVTRLATEVSKLGEQA